MPPRRLQRNVALWNPSADTVRFFCFLLHKRIITASDEEKQKRGKTIISVPSAKPEVYLESYLRLKCRIHFSISAQNDQLAAFSIHTSDTHSNAAGREEKRGALFTIKENNLSE